MRVEFDKSQIKLVEDEFMQNHDFIPNGIPATADKIHIKNTEVEMVPAYSWIDENGFWMIGVSNKNI